jgi:hypothetical protein
VGKEKTIDERLASKVILFGLGETEADVLAAPLSADRFLTAHT